MAGAWYRMRSRLAPADIGMCSSIRRARRACCSKWSRDIEPMTSPCNGGQELKRREQIRDEIVEIVNRETRAWDTKDVALLISVFHTDMVWPWPGTAQSPDPMDWVMVMGRYDRERWMQVWQQLFDTPARVPTHA